MTDLIVDDSYYHDMAICIEKLGELTRENLDNIINALDTAASDAIISGKTAEAIKNYKLAVDRLKPEVDSITERAKQLMLDFPKNIDDIDKNLY